MREPRTYQCDLCQEISHPSPSLPLGWLELGNVHLCDKCLKDARKLWRKLRRATNE